jgi:hypothetical protein
MYFVRVVFMAPSLVEMRLFSGQDSSVKKYNSLVGLRGKRKFLTGVCIISELLVAFIN